jgi:hypothetical protein
VILFVPAYDEPTGANLAVAERLPERSDEVRLFGGDATRSKLLAAILPAAGNLRYSLFAMSHGSRYEVREQGGGTALCEGDWRQLELLVFRHGFAFACHTATALGRVAAEHGVTWWGYTGTIQSPSREEPFVGLFVSIFDFLREAFAEATSRDARARVVDELRRRCNDASLAVDAAFEADDSVDPSEALLCLLHVWDRLRIWVPGNETPECHPAARPPSLML